MIKPIRFGKPALLIAASLATATATAAGAAKFPPIEQFEATGGEQIYASVCAGCHMPGGRGAIGAGAYPKLAQNPNLEVAGYPVSIILHGQKAMPALGPMFSDQQIADVVNYLRSHFGNDYKDVVTVEDVKTARGPE